MGVIVCATRGGEGSRAVQLKAIEKAKRHDHRLVFLFVVNEQAVGEFDDKLSGAVNTEFHWLGKVLLSIARQRAERAGIGADVAIREGNVRQEIEDFLRETGAELLMLGAPRGISPIFGDDAIEHFAQTIEQDTDVTVELVRPESVPSGETVHQTTKVDT